MRFLPFSDLVHKGDMSGPHSASPSSLINDRRYIPHSKKEQSGQSREPVGLHERDEQNPQH